jgi:hypothetical protein
MIIILITLLAFIIPVGIYLWREWKKNKDKEAKEGLVPKRKEPLSIAGLVRVSVLLLIMAVPIYIFSDLPYSYYPKDDGMLKIAFKHSGTRVADCEEADLIKQEGEKYRQQLKDTRQVRMSIEKIAKCPRERNPVVIELFIDGQKVLDKSYSPTGLKKDMASYIYDEFPVPAGEHSFRMLLYNTGKKDIPAYALDEKSVVKPREVKVVWFSDKADALILE